MLKSFIIALTSRNRNTASNTQLGVLLAFTAGAVNAVGFLLLGSYTSHMTGIVSSIADYFALSNLAAALRAISFVVAFISGAITTSLLTNIARQIKLQSEYAPALLLESILLSGFFFWVAGTQPPQHGGAGITTALIILLCFIMGLQNAVITKISRAVIRTTHITGMATDIGIELGRQLSRKLLRNSAISTSKGKLALHGLLLCTFLSGGIVAGLLFEKYGVLVVAPFPVLLATISVIPLMEDLQHRLNA